MPSTPSSDPHTPGGTSGRTNTKVSSLEDHVPLGPFDLTGFVGKGGMGEVWEGRHRHSDVRVAVKVVTLDKATDDRYIRRFNNEVASVAALNHPSIVTVLDYGHIDEDGESTRFFEPSTPYLAMEFAEAGTLRRIGHGLDWPGLRELLLDILQGLAHAHARGVIHRDLKPSNILLASDEIGELTPKISDFGLAFIPQQALAEEGARYRTGGTPQYMAPEQFRTAWRDYGPWTDLYALGCMAWELTTGSTPFSSSKSSVPSVREGHLEGALPHFRARMALPDQFSNWLARLLEKNPRDRFRTAADAAWSLLNLEPPTDDAERRAHRQFMGDFGTVKETRKTVPTTLGSTFLEQQRQELPPLHERSQGTQDKTITPLEAAPPPISNKWAQDIRPRFPTNLMGAGLRLFGLRELPVVDRETERDRLWSALQSVHAGEGARLLLLRGAAGTGKTRLARWLREYAYQTGTALQMEAMHNPGVGRSDGLVPMVDQFLGCTGLTPTEAKKRVREWLEANGVTAEYEYQALAQLVHPPNPDQEKWVEFSGDNERQAVLRRFLDTITEDRPIVIQLEDLQWGYRTLQFLNYALNHPGRSELDVLFVGTLRNEALSERPLEAELLKVLSDSKYVDQIQVKALPEEANNLLIEKLLHLSPRLSHKIAARSGNNPLFAVQLVADWVDRGLLEVGERGFELAAEADDALPDGLYEVWSGRLDRLLNDRSADEKCALELGAALGLEVDAEEWRWVCGQRGIPVPDELLQSMFRQSLATQTDRGWAFAHSMLRETLERRAKEAGRWQSHCRISARMLQESRVSNQQERQSYRLAQYRLAAGDKAEAIEPLLEAVQNRIDRADNDAATYLLGELESTFSSLDIGEGDRDWGGYLYRRGSVLLRRGELEEAQDYFERALKEAEANGWDTIAFEARIWLSHCAHYLGEPERSLKISSYLIDTLAPDEQPVRYARALRAKAEVYLSTGKYREAQPLLAESFQLTKNHAPIEFGRVIYQSGVAALFANDYKEAKRYFREGVNFFEDQGNHYGLARCLNGLGEVERMEGRLEQASEHYSRASTAASLVESPELADIEASRAQLAIKQNNFQEAKAILLDFQNSFAQAGTAYIRTIFTSLLVCCDAALEDWSDLENDRKHLKHLLEKTSIAAPDIPEALALGARKAQKQGRSGVADDLAEMAARQYEALDNADKAAELREEFPEAEAEAAETSEPPGEAKASDEAGDQR